MTLILSTQSSWPSTPFSSSLWWSIVWWGQIALLVPSDDVWCYIISDNQTKLQVYSQWYASTLLSETSLDQWTICISPSDQWTYIVVPESYSWSTALLHWWLGWLLDNTSTSWVYWTPSVVYTWDDTAMAINRLTDVVSGSLARTWQQQSYYQYTQLDYSSVQSSAVYAPFVWTIWVFSLISIAIYLVYLVFNER